MALTLTDQEKAEFGRLYAKYPQYSDVLDEIITASGIEAFDPYEALPISISQEIEAFSEGYQESATLGYYEGEEVPRAGKAEMPYFGEVQPSRVAGNIAGSITPGLGAYIGAGKGVRALGMVAKAKPLGSWYQKGGIVVGTVEKGTKLSKGGKVLQIVSAEAIPGAIQGYIQSDGDIDEIIKMVAIWTAAGLIMEGTGTLAIKGWKKIREGKKLPIEQQEAVNVTGDVAKEQLDGAGIPTDRDGKEELIGSGLTFKDLIGRLPGLSKWSQTEKAETIGRAIVNDDQREHIVDLFNSSGAPGVRFSELALGDPDSDIIPTMMEIIGKDITDIEQYDIIRSALRAVKDGYENFDLTSKEQGAELLDMFLHGQITFKDLERFIKQEIPAAQASLGPRKGGSAGAQWVEFSRDEIDKEILKIHKRAYKSPEGAMRGKSGRFEQRVLDQEATDDQRLRLSEVVTEINKSLERLEEPMISSEIMNKLFDPKNSMNKVRQMDTYLRGQVLQIEGRSSQKALSATLREDIDPHRIQEMLVENASKGWKSAFARTKGWQSEKSFKENIKEIREALVKERIRHKLDPEGKYWIPAAGVKGKPDPTRGRVARQTADPSVEIFEELGLPYFLKMTPPYSRWGLGSHPLTKQGVEYGMNMFEEIGKLKMDWIKRYQEMVKPLSAGNKQQLFAAMGRTSAKEAVEEEIRNKNLLVQALNGENVNEILSQNANLVPIYNQIRGLLDESGEHIGIGFRKQGYLKDYFPHIFDGTTGAYRARRLSMEIGSRIGKVTHYLDKTRTDGIPALKYFGSKESRAIGAEGYNRDLDAVMYSYLSGAAEVPFYNDFLEMSKKLLLRLPTEDAAKRELNLKGSYSNWVNYVVGRPSDWKKQWAKWWQDNDLFNLNIDHLVELIGDAETKGLMTLLRGKTLGKGTTREGGYTFSKAEERKAIDWFDGLIKEANQSTIEGKMKGMSVKQFRARLALKIDDIRAGLANPHARPVVLESMYRSMVVAKLGLSVSHGLINLTQTLVDAMPLLGLKGVARGVQRYVGNPQHKFKNGETVEDVINASGILSDIPEAREFTPTRGLGFLSQLEEVAMAPARISENFNRGVAFLGKYERSIGEGMEHATAVIDARRFVQKVHFPFNRAGTIPLFYSPGARFLLMFKSYALHQMNFSAELLENAIKDNDVGPLAKHLLAYAALGSAASMAAGGGASNLTLQVGHPIEDFSPTNLASRGVLETVGGPPADMILDLLHGNYMAAMESYGPVVIKRLKEAGDEEKPSNALLTGLGFR